MVFYGVAIGRSLCGGSVVTYLYEIKRTIRIRVKTHYEQIANLTLLVVV